AFPQTPGPDEQDPDPLSTRGELDDPGAGVWREEPRVRRERRRLALERREPRRRVEAPVLSPLDAARQEGRAVDQGGLLDATVPQRHSVRRALVPGGHAGALDRA